jgi:transposase-like protein
MSQFIDILEEKCPKCGEGKVFAKKGNPLLFRMPKMYAKCPCCGHKFEKETGYFFGSMYVSYGLTVAEMILVFLVAHFFIKSFAGMMALIAGLAVLLSTFNFRLSRMIWIYMLDGKHRTV